MEYQSDFINWSGFKSYPLLVQDPFPVIIGGAQGNIYQRIAHELKSVCADEGRNYDDIEITAMWTMQGGLDSGWLGSAPCQE